MEYKTPQNPCYDIKTKTSCPDRHSGCAITCPKWADYEKARAAVYDKRKVSFETDDIVFKQQRKRTEKHLKSQIRFRRFRRK